MALREKRDIFFFNINQFIATPFNKSIKIKFQLIYESIK